MLNKFHFADIKRCFVSLNHSVYCLILKQLLKRVKTSNNMTTSQESSRKISLEMKSEVHYKKAAKSYRKSQQYIKMINLYPTLQNTLIECKDENLIE